MRLKISEFAALAGVHPQTVRNYERQGLIHPKRDKNNCRIFAEEDVQKLKEIIYPSLDKKEL
jgi:MerR family transcriptional regulator, heat shock protein HspR